MVYPKAESISSLANYAKDIHTFSDSYLSAANMSYRTYSVALSGQHGDAIQLFVDKLNTLQAQLFDSYPTALAAYAQTVAAYEQALTGHGFHERMWSDLGEATNLKTLYTGDQATEISDRVSEMNALLKAGAEAAGVEAPDLTSIQSTATEGFSTAGSDRVNLATAVDGEWKTFTGTLTENAKTIQAFQSLINHVIYFTQVTPGDVAFRMTKGHLPASRMYYLDGINNESDVQAVKLLMSEEDYPNKADFFTDLGRFKNASQMSEGGADAIHGRLYEEMYRLNSDGYSENLGYFFQSMTVNHTKEDASEYAKKLSLASARFATVLKTQAIGEIPEFPPEGSPDWMYEEYYQKMQSLAPYLTHINGRLENASLLNDIFEYVYTNELGAQTYEPDGLPHTVKAIDKDTLRFNNKGDTKEVQFTVVNGLVPDFNLMKKSDYDNYTDPFDLADQGVSRFYYETEAKVTLTDHQTAGEVNIGKAAERLDELREEQKNATKDFIADLAVAATGEIPFLGAAVSSAKTALFDKDIVGAVYDASESILPPGVDTAKKVYETLVAYVDKVETVDAEIKTTNDSIHANLFDIGGTVPTNGGEMKSRFNSTYDLEGTLRQYDMEQNGLRGHSYRDARMDGKNNIEAIKQVNSFSEYLNLEKSVSGDVKELFQGDREHGHTISDESKNGISSQDVYDGLQSLSKTGDFSFADWQATDSKYFSNLVGSNTKF